MSVFESTVLYFFYFLFFFYPLLFQPQKSRILIWNCRRDDDNAGVQVDFLIGDFHAHTKAIWMDKLCSLLGDLWKLYDAKRCFKEPA